MSELTETALRVLKKRYFRVGEGWDELCARVAGVVAAPDNGEYEGLFFKIINDLDFLPNSPCLMNAGTELGQLAACFVLPVEDSLEGIFEAVKNGALIHQTGGGTGYSFSRLRPEGAAVGSTNGVASGPVSFAKVFDTATEVIKQGGKRRGANMGVLRVDHPDVLKFVRAKEVEGDLANFNLSIALTDDFMEAVMGEGCFLPRNEAEGYLDGRVMSNKDARKLFSEIVHHTWSNGEPGILFIDAANRANPTPHLGGYEATNPCGELWLLPYESCNLGSINLERFVVGDQVDYKRLRSVVRVAVRFLDNVIDANKYPLPQIEEATKLTRKIGLGIMGLHGMLIQLGLPYASEEGRKKAAEVMRFVQAWAEETSEALVGQKGRCSGLNPLGLPDRRNASLTSIQPTGSVSMIADCSSGCEPYYSLVTRKTVLGGEDFYLVNKHFEAIARREGFYYDGLVMAVEEAGTVTGFDDIPEKWQEVFRCAADISAEDHIRMQAALQNNGVDSSISKTVNLPNSATEADVREAIILAHKLGCKGLTLYRDGSRKEQVLRSAKKEKGGSIEAASFSAKMQDQLPSTVSTKGPTKVSLPEVLDAKRYRLKDTKGNTIYLIVCFEGDKPMEVFAKFPFNDGEDLQEKSTMWTTVCRLVSTALRHQVPMAEIIKQLERSSGRMKDLPGQLSKLLKTFMAHTEMGYSAPCPESECSGELRFEEGCEKCPECGYSKCG
jgi:ribonucleoside-diphosphate reductase alpha chain